MYGQNRSIVSSNNDPNPTAVQEDASNEDEVFQNQYCTCTGIPLATSYISPRSDLYRTRSTGVRATVHVKLEFYEYGVDGFPSQSVS